jgi:hypothetical protein
MPQLQVYQLPVSAACMLFGVAQLFLPLQPACILGLRQRCSHFAQCTSSVVVRAYRVVSMAMLVVVCDWRQAYGREQAAC